MMDWFSLCRRCTSMIVPIMEVEWLITREASSFCLPGSERTQTWHGNYGGSSFLAVCELMPPWVGTRGLAGDSCRSTWERGERAWTPVMQWWRGMMKAQVSLRFTCTEGHPKSRDLGWMSLCTDICRNSILESWGVLQQECITGTLGRWLTVWVLLLCCRREGAAQPTGLWLRKAKATWDCKVTPCCISVGRRWGLGDGGRLLEGETHVVKGEVRVRQNQQGLIWILVRNGWNHFLLIITV